MDHAPSPYLIRPTGESSLAFDVFTTGLFRRTKYVSFFEDYRGEIHYTADNPENSRLQLVIQARSLTCREPSLKPQRRLQIVTLVKHDLLASDDHPEITFSSTRAERKNSNGCRLEGTLTLRGITKAATVDIVVVPLGPDRLELDGSATINLAGYGVKPPSIASLSRTKEEIALRFLLWPERSRAVPAAG